jgi:diguanylate cyclase (GGDEF)-like protein
LLALGWTALMAVSLAWSAHLSREKVLAMATTQARAIHQKDVAQRAWNAEHGGVYAPVTASTQPNPHLDVPDRDITTPSGVELTLINPAYMTRQVHGLEREQFGTIGHITSLEPIRPQNRADDWETEALQAFAAGADEVHSVEVIGGEEYTRLMQPLVTEPECLKCHTAQGYEVGDIRGGISVAVPMAPLWAISRPELVGEIVFHAMAWLLGLTGLGLTIRRLGRQSIERKQLESRLQRLATTDPLTGADNRRSFGERASMELARSRRYQRPLSLLMLDLDHFKAVNDRFGHAVGDEVLRTFAQVCRETLRDADVFARMGGEEFAVLLVETSAGRASLVAERLRANVARLAIPTPGATSDAVSVTVSAGAATANEDDETLDALLARADDALYRAKRAGRDRVVRS